MLNFDAYTGKNLQSFIAMLNQCEQKGVTEIRFIREKIYNYLDAKNKPNSTVTFRKKRRILNKGAQITGEDPDIKVERNLPKCPKCDKGLLTPWANDENLNIWGCKKCRYSTIMEGKDVK